MAVIYSKTGNPIMCTICGTPLLPTTPPWESKYHEDGKCRKTLLEIAEALGAVITEIKE